MRANQNIVRRYEGNPILTAEDVPYHATLVFNAGVTKFNGKYAMVFRNDYGDESARRIDGTNLGLAFSDDGFQWQVQSKPCFELSDEHIICANDPRLTVIAGRCYMTFAVITRQGVQGGIAVTDDFERFDILSMSLPDNRNLVLFPEKINGMFVRLERPFSWYKSGDERFDIWISDSTDLKYWGNSKLLLTTEEIPFANNRIGPAAPPVWTDKGWLTTFHAVYKDENQVFNGWEGNWNKKYMAGIMLLDLEDPAKIIAMSRKPLLVPEPIYEYEREGFRGNVIFPGGMILENDNEVKIYYGAADTVEALATAQINDLLNMCDPI